MGKASRRLYLRGLPISGFLTASRPRSIGGLVAKYFAQTSPCLVLVGKLKLYQALPSKLAFTNRGSTKSSGRRTAHSEVNPLARVTAVADSTSASLHCAGDAC